MLMTSLFEGAMFFLFIFIIVITTIGFDSLSKRILKAADLKSWQTLKDMLLILTGYVSTISMELVVVSLLLN